MSKRAAPYVLEAQERPMPAAFENRKVLVTSFTPFTCAGRGPGLRLLAACPDLQILRVQSSGYNAIKRLQNCRSQTARNGQINALGSADIKYHNEGALCPRALAIHNAVSL